MDPNGLTQKVTQACFPPLRKRRGDGGDVAARETPPLTPPRLRGGDKQNLTGVG